MKTGAPDHRKMKMLARLLKIPLPYANGIMERLWHATEQYAPDGALGRSSNYDIAEYCAMPMETDPDTFVQALSEVGFLDPLPLPTRFYVHDWHEHCTHYTQNKLARKHLFFANGRAPSLARLGEKHKAEAEKFYVSAQTGPVSAHPPTRERSTDAVGAHDGDISAHADSEENSRERSRGPKKRSRTPLTGARAPHPHPHPHPHQQQQQRNSGTNGGGAKWAAAVAEVQEEFPSTPDGFVEDLASRCTAALEKAGREKSIPLMTDEVLRDAIRASRIKNQQSAGFYLTAVPTVIVNWAKPKRRNEA